MLKSTVDWGEGLVKYVCGCKQVIGEDICPVHQKGTMMTKNEKETIQLRQAGCSCKLPLFGYIPDQGPRCRLCGTEVVLEHAIYPTPEVDL